MQIKQYSPPPLSPLLNASVIVKRYPGLSGAADGYFDERFAPSPSSYPPGAVPRAVEDGDRGWAWAVMETPRLFLPIATLSLGGSNAMDPSGPIIEFRVV